MVFAPDRSEVLNEENDTQWDKTRCRKRGPNGEVKHRWLEPSPCQGGGPKADREGGTGEGTIERSGPISQIHRQTYPEIQKSYPSEQNGVYRHRDALNREVRSCAANLKRNWVQEARL